ncbi:siphovirus ReqiPepy6 Gp37-like family protein [Bacillus spongiae]|uniref:Siphovirus ReqiPepy6 Gp37-like family protein n=1 Tax=Bacillus spongiae TaxID=2683610 RepID=A0ABU8HJX8_9BACI
MLKILTPQMEWIAEIDDYISFQLTKKWHDVGSFELHINRHSQSVEELQKNRLVMLSPNKVGIIKHIEVALDENGRATENYVYKGYDLKGIFGQRLTLPPSNTAYDNKSGAAETVLKHYVERNAVNPTDRKRKFVMLRMEDDLQRGNSINWQSRFKILSEELRDISLTSGVGWDVSLNLKEGWWEFDALDGKDLSYKNQFGNSPVYFSPEFENVQTMGFSDSDLNMKNVAFVAGQGEGVEREVAEIGNTEDFERIETFIDARDIEKNGVGDNGETLQERGERTLEQLRNELFLEAEILTHSSPFQYEKDFFLGDIVTIMNRDWGVMSHERVTEAKEIFEHNGYKLELTFGKNRPTLISKIKDGFSQFDNELRR